MTTVNIDCSNLKIYTVNLRHDSVDLITSADVYFTDNLERNPPKIDDTMVKIDGNKVTASIPIAHPRSTRAFKYYMVVNSVSTYEHDKQMWKTIYSCNANPMSLRQKAEIFGIGAGSGICACLMAFIFSYCCIRCCAKRRVQKRNIYRHIEQQDEEHLPRRPKASMTEQFLNRFYSKPNLHTVQEHENDEVHPLADLGNVDF